MTTSKEKVLRWLEGGLFLVLSVLSALVLPWCVPEHFPAVSDIQVLYAALSAIVVFAVFLWGVGRFSRFFPQEVSEGAAAGQQGSAAPLGQAGQSGQTGQTSRTTKVEQTAPTGEPAQGGN